MNKIGHGIILWVGMAVMAAHAQAPLVPPSPPFVNKVDAFSTWKITFQLKDSPNPPVQSGQMQMPVRQEIRITKTDKMRREVTQWTNGNTSEIWYVGQYSLERTAYRDDIYIEAKDHAVAFGPVPVQSFEETDFPDLGWLSAQCYTGVASYQGRKCFHFQFKQGDMISVPQPPGAPKKLFPSHFAGLMKEAWIDVKTKLPCAATDGGKFLKIYTFQEGKVEGIELPEPFAKALHDYLERARTAR